jgi:hypothetical protein
MSFRSSLKGQEQSEGRKEERKENSATDLLPAFASPLKTWDYLLVLSPPS